MRIRPLAAFVAVVSVALLALLGLGWTRPAATAQSRPASVDAPPVASTSNRSRAPAGLRGTSLMFVENVGQFDPKARFQVRRGDTTIHLADDALWFTILEQEGGEGGVRHGANLKLSFPGANPRPRLEPFDRLETRISYFVGSEPTAWRTGIPAWGGVRYVDLYPGVDLEMTSENGQWAWRLVVRDSRFELSDVRLRVEGADDLLLGDDHLRLTTAVDGFALPLLAVEGAAPEGQPRIVRSKPGIFEVTAPFLAQCPALNPQDADDLLYSTCLGGDANDVIQAGAILGGDVYVAGWTASANFTTTTGVIGPDYIGDRDAFVARISPDGNGQADLVYATYLGGSTNMEGGDPNEEARGLAVDSEGNVYLTGLTISEDFPTTPGAYDTSYNGSGDAFVTKINADATALLYSTYLGGDFQDQGWDIALDELDRAYVTGSDYSSDFPTTEGAYQEDGGGLVDAFVVRLNAGGSDLDYGTLLGGTGLEEGKGIAVDASNNAYVTGYTLSSDFPIAAAAGYDKTYAGGDAFVVKLNHDGSDLAYGTFLGGAQNEWGWDIAIDNTNRAYVTGWTFSDDFPITDGVLDPDFGEMAQEEAFVARLNASGSALDYATYLGGTGAEVGYGITADAQGNAYVTGETTSPDFPVTADCYDGSHNGAGIADVFVARINHDGSALDYGTYLGGLDEERGWDIATDGEGQAYVVGQTKSNHFPTTDGALDRSANPGDWFDGFVSILAMEGGAGPAPPTVDFERASYSVDEDGGSATIAVALSPVATQTVTVSYATSDGTAEFPGDYAATSGILTFNVGDTSQAFDVPIVDDGDEEEDEIVTLTLSDAHHAQLGTANNPAALTILDDDGDGPTPPPTSTERMPFYSTFLGGGENDYGTDIAVDRDGDAYVIGHTSSSSFPASSGVFSDTLNGGSDVFVAKIHPANDGANDLVYATFIGGSAGDAAGGIAVDDDENVYITGWSNRSFPDTDGSFADCDDGGAFVTKLNDTGSALLYSGCIAGFNAEGQDIALDGLRRAYVSGRTGGGFPATAGAYQQDHGGGSWDAFLAIVSTDGVTLTYATYVGGNDNECAGTVSGCTLDLDDDDNVYLAGDTESPNFPTKNAYDAACGTDGNCNPGGGYTDAFLVKLNPAGHGASDLLYATFIGGSGGDLASGVAVDSDGHAYLTGETSSQVDFPTTPGAHSEEHGGGYSDAFLLQLNPAVSGPGGLVYASYLGGRSNGDKGRDIAVDAEGYVYAVGVTNSDNFPTTVAGYDTALGGWTDAFVVKFGPSGHGMGDLRYGAYIGGDSGTEIGYALAVDAGGNVYMTGETEASDFPTSVDPFDTTYNGGNHDAFMVRLPTKAYGVYLPMIVRGN